MKKPANIRGNTFIITPAQIYLDAVTRRVSAFGREDIKERAFDNRASDRLLHMDEINQANLEGYLSARGRRRRKFLRQVASWAL